MQERIPITNPKVGQLAILYTPGDYWEYIQVKIVGIRTMFGVPHIRFATSLKWRPLAECNLYEDR